MVIVREKTIKTHGGQQGRRRRKGHWLREEDNVGGIGRNQVVKGSKGRGVGNTPAVPIKDYDHLELRVGEKVPIELLVLIRDEEAAFLFLSLDFFFLM